MLNRKVIAVVIILGLVLVSQGCTSESSPTEPDLVRVQVAPYISYAPFYLADAEGYFSEENIDIEILQISNFQDVFPLVIKGDLDVIAGTFRVSMYSAIASGEALRVVADKGYVGLPGTCPYFTYVANNELLSSGKLDDPSGLAGLKISIEPAGSSGYYMEKIMAGSGLSLEDIEPANIPPPARGEALASGQLDLALLAEPWVTRVTQAGQGSIWSPAEEVMPNFQLGIVMYGPNLLEKDPELGERFMAAYLKGVAAYNQGKTVRNLEILTAARGLDEPLLKDICWPPIRPDGSVDLDSLMDFQDWAAQSGYIDAKVGIDDIFESRFIDAVNK